MSEVISFKDKSPPVCAFCKKPKSKDNPLIGEEGKPHICYRCVKRCNELLKESEVK